ncbi:LysR family transcriptional regulator [Verrucomicrobium sp. BvORR034]|uniref:LysR family transcriptional regulator n=1 Tax=Verrucomicrobium sp. BvORR034 TaxID=1396418 RepID=UPI00067854E5|nr:LysR family transcriptional regulator [Verrucomicrobium sp. BvORR034]
MELHQLRYMVAVARTGNFSRAAQTCHVSQPSLSQQIQKLEDELGERLFDRLRRHAKLTQAGERFLPRAVRILEEMDAATREARAANDLDQGRITVGVLPTIAPYLLPKLIAAFSAKYPGVQVVVHEDTTARLRELTAACEVDIAIASLPLQDERFEVRELFDEELLLALPTSHRLVNQKKIIPEDLLEEKFILMKEGHCLGDQVLHFCHRQDFHPQVSCRSAQMETVQSLVQSGMGITLVPRMALQEDRSVKPVYRSLSDPSPKRTIVAFWPKQRPLGKAAAAWLKLMEA